MFSATALISSEQPSSSITLLRNSLFVIIHTPLSLDFIFYFLQVYYNKFFSVCQALF